MSDEKGPKVSVPDELLEELDASATPPPTQEPPKEASDPSEDAPATDEAAELKDKYLRLAAEFDNYKRRTLKERQDLFNYANEGLLKELLVTVDNLERATESCGKEEATGELASLIEGVELTYRSLMQTLEKSEVRVVFPDGERFDPQVHEAMRQVPSAEVDPGRVVEVYQKGYLLKDRLLRPALVAVSSRPEGSADAPVENASETESEDESLVEKEEQ